YFYTASSGLSTFPEYVAVGMLDGLQIVYYDSNTKTTELKQVWHGIRLDQEITQNTWRAGTLGHTSEEPAVTFKVSIEIWKQRFNQTGGGSDQPAVSEQPRPLGEVADRVAAEAVPVAAWAVGSVADSAVAIAAADAAAPVLANAAAPVPAEVADGRVWRVRVVAGWKPQHEQRKEQEPKRPHIKKPLNAFMLYMKEMRANVVAECTLKESAAINQILGRRVGGPAHLTPSRGPSKPHTQQGAQQTSHPNTTSTTSSTVTRDTVSNTASITGSTSSTASDTASATSTTASDTASNTSSAASSDTTSDTPLATFSSTPLTSDHATPRQKQAGGEDAFPPGHLLQVDWMLT
ncbi:hypothetical protein CRUP_030442, partial [Coryphaenoides rupestris]